MAFMETTTAGCRGIDVRQVPGVEDPAPVVGLTTWRERQNDLALVAHSIIHEHRRLTAKEIGRYHIVLEELHEVGAAIAKLEREAGAASAGPGT